MASPTFNGNKIFDSIDGEGNRYSEGVLWAPEFQKIIQTLHFNGENGDRILTHGYPDRPWVFTGIISAPSIGSLNTLLAAIQTCIQDCDTTGGYHTLVDSFGHSYSNAQVRHYSCQDIRRSADGYLAVVRVTGVIRGMVKEA